jgi:beta-mannanase
LSTTQTASAIASGADDAAIQAWAQAYASWVALGGHRRAFIAPLQEMNGYWTSYGLDPDNFRAAYQRIQTIFAQTGISRSQVWWTFAPNGYTRPGDPPIQAYYPGDDKVDIVSFSAYNFGSCSGNPWPLWQTPDQVFGPYIATIRQQVTASKPIFVAEAGTTSAGGDKDKWLRDAYAYLVQQNIRGILYFNSDKECDWAIYQPWLGGRQVQGYKDALLNPNLRYFAPANLAVYTLPP